MKSEQSNVNSINHDLSEVIYGMGLWDGTLYPFEVSAGKHLKSKTTLTSEPEPLESKHSHFSSRLCICLTEKHDKGL